MPCCRFTRVVTTALLAAGQVIWLAGGFPSFPVSPVRAEESRALTDEADDEVSFLRLTRDEAIVDSSERTG